jgi:hypothetical protein
MTEEERLRSEAERCLRLARQITANDVAATLTKLASDYLQRAKTLESGAGQRQQRGDRPPPAAQAQQPTLQQQQQTQPKEGQD